MTEPEFLALLRALPLHPGTLGLADDAETDRRDRELDGAKREE